MNCDQPETPLRQRAYAPNQVVTEYWFCMTDCMYVIPNATVAERAWCYRHRRELTGEMLMEKFPQAIRREYGTVGQKVELAVVDEL